MTRSSFCLSSYLHLILHKAVQLQGPRHMMADLITTRSSPPTPPYDRSAASCGPVASRVFSSPAITIWHRDDFTVYCNCKHCGAEGKKKKNPSQKEQSNEAVNDFGPSSTMIRRRGPPLFSFDDSIGDGGLRAHCDTVDAPPYVLHAERSGTDWCCYGRWWPYTTYSVAIACSGSVERA